MLATAVRPRLGELVSPLVIDEKGCLLPIAYGVDPRWQLGTLSNPRPYYDAKLLELVERTWTSCEDQRFATVYPDFVRESMQ